MRKTETGCRPAQLFGLWAIEPQAFRAMYAQAMRVDLVALGNSRKADGSPSAPLPSQRPDVPAKKKPYQMDGAIALFEITGPMTKYATSFQSIMGGTSTLSVRNAIRSAMMDDDVLGACIYMDSPGGTVDGTQALANDIAAFAAMKPCIGFIDGLGCSALYWAASQCTSIYASPTSLVGSIGAAMRLEDTSGQFTQAGVKVHMIGTGEMKGAGADGTEITDAQMAYFQNIVDSQGAIFFDAVARGRKLNPKQMSVVTDASVFLADKAKSLGLVDFLGSEDDAMAAAKHRVFFG